MSLLLVRYSSLELICRSKFVWRRFSGCFQTSLRCLWSLGSSVSVTSKSFFSLVAVLPECLLSDSLVMEMIVYFWLRWVTLNRVLSPCFKLFLKNSLCIFITSVLCFPGVYICSTVSPKAVVFSMFSNTPSSRLCSIRFCFHGLFSVSYGFFYLCTDFILIAPEVFIFFRPNTWKHTFFLCDAYIQYLYYSIFCTDNILLISTALNCSSSICKHLAFLTLNLVSEMVTIAQKWHSTCLIFHLKRSTATFRFSPAVFVPSISSLQ